jgi:hypothetical protein
MAASLRLTRSVAKAVLPNRMGRIDLSALRAHSVGGLAFPFGEAACLVYLSVPPSPSPPASDVIGIMLAVQGTGLVHRSKEGCR